MKFASTEVVRLRRRLKIIELSNLESSKLKNHADDKIKQMSEYILKVVMGVGLE